MIDLLPLGHIMYTVVFRMVVFHPFVGEVLVGKIVGSNKDGLRGKRSFGCAIVLKNLALLCVVCGTVSVGFFSDITIPSYLLQQPAE